MERKLKRKSNLKNFSQSFCIVVSIVFFVAYFSACDKKDEVQKSSDTTKTKDTKVETQKSSDNTKQSDSTGKQIIYSCPMHPEVQSTNKEYKCPKCGMKLEERKAK